MKQVGMFSLIGVMMLLVGCSGEESSATGMSPERAMEIAHCQMMPLMKGCEQYAQISEEELAEAMHQACEVMPGMHGCDAIKKKDTTDRDISSLPRAKAPEIVELSDGDLYEMSIGEVKKTLAGKDQLMRGYNGMIPGPILKVPQGANITVRVTNTIDDATTVHWHGLRGDPRFDGVPKDMGGEQDPMGEGDAFDYELVFPDEGMYWYHPHVREDKQQELGLAGNLWVISEDDGWNDVDQEEVLILDDILLQDGSIASFDESITDHALMGRFGNTYLINGEEDYRLNVTQGEVIRLYLTNIANTRTFRFALPGAKIKRVGGDLGRYQRDEWVDAITIAPAERYIVEVLYSQDGDYTILNDTPDYTDTIGKVSVSKSATSTLASQKFGTLSEYDYIERSIENHRKYLQIEPTKKLNLSVQMGGVMAGMDHSGMMHSGPDGIEWSDTMSMMNESSTSKNTTWKLIDEESGQENMNISWDFEEGDVVKVRLYNDPDSDHPMQHPIHFHGQRFLVTDRNGTLQENLVWKDTVLVPTGEYVDILLDTSNPGTWMAHCHIAEHLSSGMMMHFDVAPAPLEDDMREIRVSADRFSFDPQVITVEQGEKVKLVIDNVDTAHGIGIPDMQVFGDTQVVLDTSKKGTFPFVCANFCDAGHEGMGGTIIVQ